MISPALASSSREKTRPRGFILVAVLLVVAVVTLLMVVSSMLSQIERRAAANSGAVEVARSNALFALDVALNQLQAQAGPDQRITARAEILDSTPATLAVTGVNQPYWTGIWRTGDAKLDIGGASSQRSVSLGAANPSAAQKDQKAVWLVSSTNAVSPLTFNGTIQGNARDAVVLASNFGPTPTNIIAPLVPVLTGNRTAGAYAFWVSDEGVKAKVNLQDPTLGVSPSGDPSRSQAHFLVPHATLLPKAVQDPSAIDIRANVGLPKISTLASLSSLTPASVPDFSGPNAKRYAADLTTVGSGVLADVRRGGLKKDLTAAFESTAAFGNLTTTYGNGAQMLYRSASSAGLATPAVDTGITPPMDGMLWHNLFFHYNSYKGVQPAPTALSTGGNAPLTPTGSGNPATLPQVQSQRAYSLNLSGTTVKTGFLSPVPVAYRVDIALSSYESGGTWKLRLHYYPQLVLWNPYGVRLNLANYQFQRDVGAFSTAGSYSVTSPTLTCIRVTTTTGGTPTTIPYFKVNQATNSGRLQLRTASGNAATMEPGETRVFALDADSIKASPAAAINFGDLVSNVNTTADFSQQCDVLSGVDGNGTSTGAAFTTPDPATIVQVQIAAPSLRCQNVDTFALPNGAKWPWNDGTVRIYAGGDWNLSAAASSWPANLRIDQLNGAPLRIIGFYVRQKGLRASSSSYSYSNASNAVPVFLGNASTVNPIEDLFSYGWQEVYLSQFGTLYSNGQTDVQVGLSGTSLESSFGSESAGAAPPGTRVVLRDVSTQPMISLGQFMHLPAMNFWSIASYQSLALGSMAVGGSYASPILPTSENAGNITTNTSSAGVPSNRLLLDDSFLANEALFDRFFLSTVPPQNLNAAGTVYPATWTEFNAANSGTTLTDSTKRLLNSRLRPYYKDGAPPQMADLRDMEKASASLVLDGAFNVNSTSVPAWKAFLGGLSGNDLRLWNSTTQSATSVSIPGGVPLSRFWSASGLTNANTPWSGLRVLSDDELSELASRIVEQVKLRGPFLSMADFLNRRLGAAGALTRSGTLQAAIDSTSPDLNATAKAQGTTVNAVSPPEVGKVPNFIAANMQDANGNAWNTAIGMPGYLMQQDLVQALSSAMSARSDAFLVRVYGEVRNRATGKIEGRAWGEATVQRVPDLVDNSQLPEISPASMNDTNKAFGRRFKVVGFRWLNDNEV